MKEGPQRLSNNSCPAFVLFNLSAILWPRFHNGWFVQRELLNKPFNWKHQIVGCKRVVRMHALSLIVAVDKVCVSLWFSLAFDWCLLSDTHTISRFGRAELNSPSLALNLSRDWDHSSLQIMSAVLSACSHLLPLRVSDDCCCENGKWRALIWHLMGYDRERETEKMRPDSRGRSSTEPLETAALPSPWQPPGKWAR